MQSPSFIKMRYSLFGTLGFLAAGMIALTFLVVATILLAAFAFALLAAAFCVLSFLSES